MQMGGKIQLYKSGLFVCVCCRNVYVGYQYLCIAIIYKAYCYCVTQEHSSIASAAVNKINLYTTV
jgi:hypothetical protein